MSNLNDLTALALPSGSRLVADETENRLSLSLDGQPLVQLRLSRDPELKVQREEGGDLDTSAVWAACYWLFARDPACQRLIWRLSRMEPDGGLAQRLAGGPTKRPGSSTASARSSGSCRSRGLCSR